MSKKIKGFDKEKLVSKTKIYLIIIAILFIIVCCYERRWLLPSAVAYCLITLYSIWASSKKKEEILEHIKDITINVDTVAKNTLINSPFPMVIIEDNGSIIWKSTQFASEFSNIDVENSL
ncbi:MAG: hypothetical protein Q4G05_00895, partial [Clostridia bacterium]|nr:hypothetical protein [Clostridia bacterium]